MNQKLKLRLPTPRGEEKHTQKPAQNFQNKLPLSSASSVYYFNLAHISSLEHLSATTESLPWMLDAFSF